MAKETQYTANTWINNLSIANPNLDGITGAYATVITGAANGTLVKNITIKAQVSTTQGMVRIFSGTKLVFEIPVPAITKSATVPAFETTIETNFDLASGQLLVASTEKGESMNTIAEGLDWAYYATVRPESTKYTANTAMATVSVANPNLDSTGTLATVLTGAANGTTIQSIVIKATGNTTDGMVRLFIFNPTTGFTRLFMEIPVPAITKSATDHSFSHRIDFGGKGFALKSGFTLRASTEKAETFNVIAEGLDWAYPA